MVIFLSPTHQKLWDALAESGSAKTAETSTGLNTKAVERGLAKLVAVGLLAKEGDNYSRVDALDAPFTVGEYAD